MRMNTGRKHYHHPFAPTTIEVYTPRRRRLKDRALLIALGVAVGLVSLFAGLVLPEIWK